MESSNLDTTEEIVIVGSRHGVLADIVKPLFEKGEPIKKKDIKKILGGDEVLIYPESNEYDKYAVGVFTRSHRPLGHVWSSQSPAVSEWMAKHKRGYVRGRIEEIITKNGLMMARVDTPMLLQRTSRSSRWDDCDWANDLPEVVTNNVNRSLKVCIELLKDELRKATEWNEDLQFRIDNLIEYLQLDLSAHCNDEGNVLFGMMNHSEIEEVRAQCYDVASAFVNRGSKSHMEWWIKEWLPQFLKDASKGNLMKIFEDDDYNLERVEEILRLAPERLFYLYKYERERFASALYYSDFPESLYFRFLTLLAVWEAMKGINLNDNLNDNLNENEDEKPTIDDEIIIKAVSKVKKYMWATSAFGVLFCVCRDRYGFPDNMSQFERVFDGEKGIKCPAGTIVSAFRYNSYMRIHIDKWNDEWVKERAIILKDRFIEAMDKFFPKLS